MALTNPQGKVILTNGSSERVLFPVTNGLLPTAGINLTSSFTTTNLVSWWRLEQNTNVSGGIKDSAYTDLGIGANPGNHGTKFGTAGVVTGPTNGGNGFTFSGDDYVAIADSSSLRPVGRSFSIEIWQKAWTNGAGGGPNYDRFMYHYNDTSNAASLIILALRRNLNEIYFQAGSSATSASTLGATSYNDSSWNQWVVTYDHPSTTAKLYLNGNASPVYTLTSISMTNPTSVTFDIGTNAPHAIDQTIAADVDEIKFYSSALSTSEIADNYNYY